MSSAIRLPVSYNVSTFGAAGHGRDYIEGEIENWEADTDNDLVGAGKGEVLKVTDDQSVYEWTTQAVRSFGGATTNADYFRAVIYHENNTNRPYIHRTYHDTTLREAYFGWHVDFEADFTTTDIWRRALAFNADQCKIANCNIKSSQTGIGTLNNFDKTAYIINVCTHDCGHNGVRINVSDYSPVVYCYNITTVNNGAYGFANYSTTATAYAKNSISQGNASGAFHGTWTQESNVTAGVQFVDESNEDYRLAASDTVAKNQGIDLSSIFDDDLLGVQRPQGSAWDIGAYEYIETTTNKRRGIRNFGFSLSADWRI